MKYSLATKLDIYSKQFLEDLRKLVSVVLLILIPSILESLATSGSEYAKRAVKARGKGWSTEYVVRV
jgi:hypothetical protein